jgi:hypothetical protein
MAVAQSENDSDTLLLAATTATKQTSLHGHVNNFFEQVVPSYSEDSFKSHFRMSRMAMQVMIIYIAFKQLNKL